MSKNPLLELIKAQIIERGPISVADYMQLVLAHPEHGYYMRKDPLGATGDFTTAPEISQVFGELIGAWLAEQWRVIQKPKCALVELGPGRGTLMNDILRATKHVSGFHEAMSIHLVETSRALKTKQWQALAGKHPDITWHEQFSDVPAKPLLLIANEFFDALPIRQYVDGRERMIGINEGNLTWLPDSKEKIQETGVPAEHIMREMAERIATHNGAGLIIDYGYEQGSGDTLQAVHEHKFHDPLVEPGTADLTAHVNFGALKNVAANCAVYGPVPQGLFLTRLGIAERTSMLSQNANDTQVSELYAGVRRLTDPAQMGELFKVMAIANIELPKPEGF